MKAYVLLDRSMSMSQRWKEAIGGINAYAKGLAQTEADVTVIAFDDFHGLQFDAIRKDAKATTWLDLLGTEAFPRGNTPLYDSIGRLVTMVESAAPEKAVLIIVTDGEENSSRVMSKEAAKQALDRVRARNWQVVFLGVDFENFAQGAGLGATMDCMVSAKASNFNATMGAAARETRAYAATGMAFNFTDEDRKEAQK